MFLMLYLLLGAVMAGIMERISDEFWDIRPVMVLFWPLGLIGLALYGMAMFLGKVVDLIADGIR